MHGANKCSEINTPCMSKRAAKARACDQFEEIGWKGRIEELRIQYNLTRNKS